LKCVIDVNILIDLNNGGILPRLFELALDVLAPDAVLAEMVEPDRNTLEGMGLGRIALSPTQLLEAARMRAEDSRLSLGDCSAFVAARDEGNSLLTGDKRLRDRAEEISLETHGVLWVLDEIEAAGLLNHAELAVSLQNLTKVLDCLSMNAKNVFSVGQLRNSSNGFPAMDLLTNNPMSCLISSTRVEPILPAQPIIRIRIYRNHDSQETRQAKTAAPAASQPTPICPDHAGDAIYGTQAMGSSGIDLETNRTAAAMPYRSVDNARRSLRQHARHNELMGCNRKAYTPGIE
jgi:predicted nucleic acid-binding protein